MNPTYAKAYMRQIEKRAAECNAPAMVPHIKRALTQVAARDRVLKEQRPRK